MRGEIEPEVVELFENVPLRKKLSPIPARDIRFTRSKQPHISVAQEPEQTLQESSVIRI